MSPDPPKLAFSAIQKKRAHETPAKDLQVGGSYDDPPGSGEAAPGAGAEGEAPRATPGFPLPVDPWRVVDAAFAHWILMLLAGVVVAALFVAYGERRFSTHYIAVAQIIKQAPANSLRQSEGGDPYQPHDLTIPNLGVIARSFTVIEKTALRLNGEYSEGMIRGGLIIQPERNTDVVKVSYTSDVDASSVLKVLQAFVEELLAFTRNLQSEEAAEMNRFLRGQLARVDLDLEENARHLLEYSRRENLLDADKQMDAYLAELGNFGLKYETARLDYETIDLRIASLEKELGKAASSSAKLRDAQDELARLLLRYTNEHPAVIEARERLLVAESEFKMAPENSNVLPKPGENPLAESLYLDIVKLRAEKEVIGKQLEKLQGVRAELAAKLEQLPRKALEYARILSEKKVLETSRSLLEARQREAALQEERATNPFRLLSMPRPAEVTVEKPVKKLAMAGAAGFAGGMGAVAMTSILLTGLGTTISSRFMLKRVTGLGYVAASPRTRGAGDPETSAWAFHTWTQIHPLLRPSPSGMLVCGILDADTKQASGELPMILASAAALRGHRVVWMPQQQGADTGAASLDQVMGGAGLEIAELSPEAVTLIPQGEKWTWDSDGRRRWGQFVEQSRPVPPAVVLVQLTDLGAPRTLLAAETMPNLLLLVPSGEIRGGEMQRLIEPFLSSRCRLIGAVLDRPKPFRIPLLNRLALGIFSAGLWMAVGGAAVAQEPPLTLGAGDSVNIAVMGRPELSRSAVSLAPDGTLTYLQVQGMKAAGLTLDELRSALNKSVAKYYKNAVVVVTPGSFQSRKVYVLGKVVKKGAINLDRPMSLVEIVAEAGGLETGLFQQNTVELADLGRSFLMRGNARVGVDMEALFLKGDMSQNVRVQAGDYLYFPSANSNEIYVLGNVKMQGTQGLLSYTTVVSAVTQAGGFTPKAYTKRVLVVRGSLHKPELHVANLEAMLEGREKGFRLEPKDILYVADKPWARAEELAGFAINAFLQSAVATWAGTNVGPFIK